MQYGDRSLSVWFKYKMPAPRRGQALFLPAHRGKPFSCLRTVGKPFFRPCIVGDKSLCINALSICL